MEFDLGKRWCHYFNELAKIPHGSYNEKGASDFVVSFAKERGLRCIQDEYWNVVVYKDASKGYENSAPLLLQAHLDMVCEANKGTDHDFNKDPLKLRVDDGWLSAEGTTLGADDGVGVAYMLSILEDDSLPHPPLECCFTVQEEMGLLGAMKLKKEYFTAKRMVSLDSGGEVYSYISTAGGMRVRSSIKCDAEPNADPAYELFVSGLSGGHSGNEIHLEKGNANVIAVRILKELELRGFTLNLVSINGGLKENAIPRECTVLFTSPSDPDELQKAAGEIAGRISVELEFSDSGFTASLEAAQKPEKRFTGASTERVVNYLYLTPNGFMHRSMAIEGLTVNSLNMGILKTEADAVLVTTTIRSAIGSYKDDLLYKMKTLAGIFGVSLDISSDYPGWNYIPVSDLRGKLASVLQRELGKELRFEASHGGTECGIFNSLGVEDIITYGPIMEHIHTPDERLDLSSFDRAYGVLTALVKECK